MKPIPMPSTAARESVSSGANPAIRLGDRVIAFEVGTGFRHLLVCDGSGARKHKGLGIVDPDRWVGSAWGHRLRIGDKDVALLRPTLADLTASLARKAAVILPKDASRIVFELGVGPGSRVLESGIGSAGLTIPLCWAVGPTGRVVVQELRDEFAQWGKDNVDKAGLGDRLEIHLGDLTLGLASGVRGGFDAVVLDQPEPWKALPHLVPVLAAGATVACYTPQVSQMEETSRTLSALGFADVRQLELIERGWEVKERGSRPSHDGLGHTGFLVFGRWLGAPSA
ncbi:MAG: tRNA (adenine57-N1/adenine58-N1)-methyltransferase catalytic subunit [Thermoplasmata archaeon]|jgi:tRNA (adenine57-N1/adenine58-N1)-methyltransferase|nr:tRNA (adenine57-N1/adenine58-N1)-methyltransferase catalytic subunit [Thermoplasmata archaeon]